MNRRNSIGMVACRLMVLSALSVLGAVAGRAAAQAPATTAPDTGSRAGFVESVDLDAFGKIAVHRDGRVKTFESFAREFMSYVSGSRTINGQPRLFTYFDLMFRPEAYADADVIYVKSKLIRNQIADTLKDSIRKQFSAIRTSSQMGGLESSATATPRETEMLADLDERLARFRKSGLISEPMLMDPDVSALLGGLETDVLRSARFVGMIDTAIAVKNPRNLRGLLRVVPPADGNFESPWMTLDELANADHPDHPGHEAHAGATAGIAPELLDGLLGSWRELETAWRAGDAATVNAASARIASLLPGVNADLYPDSARLGWESWYFKMKNFTWVWIFYALAIVPLLLHVVFRWRGARWLGLFMFVAAFGMHTFAVMLRWYVVERWPNTNMFEAVTTSAWFGGCFALLLEIFLRRSPVRCLFAIGSASASTVALMAAHYRPLELNAGISNMMPVLHDVWLYIHTNIIIFSYCLIFIASITAILYLLYRAGKAMTGRGGKQGAGDFARVGGAGSLIMTTRDGVPVLSQAKTTIGEVLDGTTMIVMELSFILLWAGLVMGAIWADHSWGRPWGWDPKEVFALNTFLIFALLIHTRLKVRDKGLWTAIIAVIGCGVMLFNWIVINFTISGLHSYA